MLQNRPTSRFLVESRRTTCTQRNTIRLSIAGISPPLVGRIEEIVRHQQRAVVGAQPRQRLVVAHLALRQRDDRLEIEIDPVGLDGARELRENLRLRDAAEVPAPHRRFGRGGIGLARLDGLRRPRRAAAAREGAASIGAAGSGRDGVALRIALSSISSCAATASARSFTSSPSSPISVASGCVAA